MLEQGRDAVVCEVDADSKPSVETVDALCRLQLTARRHGGRIRLGDSSAELSDLVAFLGLDDVFAAGEEELGVEAKGQAEEGEELRGVEEERDPVDPLA